VTAKPRSPLEHYARAQELIEQVDLERGPVSGNFTHLRVQVAHLHLRAAEVGARLSPTVAQVAAHMASSAPNVAEVRAARELGRALDGRVERQ